MESEKTTQDTATGENVVEEKKVVKRKAGKKSGTPSAKVQKVKEPKAKKGSTEKAETSKKGKGKGKKKSVDPVQTLANYKQRILANTNEDQWNELDGAWLADYGLFPNDLESKQQHHHGHAILELATEKGVKPLGLIPENTSGGKFVVELLPNGSARESSKVVYIGCKNALTNHQMSPWALLSSDKVYTTAA